MGMDLVNLIPGVGVLGKDASVLAKADRAGGAEVRNTFRAANLVTAPNRDYGSWFAGSLGTDLADMKSLSENQRIAQQKLADSATGGACR